MQTNSNIGVPVYVPGIGKKRIFTNSAFEAGLANKTIVKIRLFKRTVFLLNS